MAEVLPTEMAVNQNNNDHKFSLSASEEFLVRTPTNHDSWFVIARALNQFNADSPTATSKRFARKIIDFPARRLRAH